MLQKSCDLNSVMIVLNDCGGRASWLPAKHCFVRWSSAYNHKKSRCGKGLMVTSSQNSFIQKTFFMGWHSVNEYYSRLSMSARYLELKRQACGVYRWRLSVHYLLWHRALHVRLLSVIRSWAQMHCWGAWKAKWVLSIMVRHQRTRLLHRDGCVLQVPCSHPLCCLIEDECIRTPRCLVQELCFCCRARAKIHIASVLIISNVGMPASRGGCPQSLATCQQSLPDRTAHSCQGER